MVRCQASNCVVFAAVLMEGAFCGHRLTQASILGREAITTGGGYLVDQTAAQIMRREAVDAVIEFAHDGTSLYVAEVLLPRWRDMRDDTEAVLHMVEAEYARMVRQLREHADRELTSKAE